MDGLFNIGTDLSVWVWVAAALVTAAFVVAFARSAYNAFKELVDGDPGYTDKKRYAIRRSVISGILACLVALFCFGAYGAGTDPGDVANSGDIPHQNATPIPTKEQLKKDAQDRVDPELKKQKKLHDEVSDPDSLKKERQKADDYLKRAIDQSRQR